MLSTAVPTAVLKHSLGAVIFESGRFYGIDYYNGQHCGRRGRALSALWAGGSGAVGIDGAFLLASCASRLASAAVC